MISRKHLVTAALTVVLGACGMTNSGPAAEQKKPLATRPNAQELTRSMVKAMEGVKSGSMTGTVDVKVDDTASKESVKLGLKLASKSDARTAGSESFWTNLKAAVDGTMDAKAVKGDLDIDLSVIAKDAYVRLNSVSLASGELDQFKSTIDQIKGKWYVFAGAVDQAKSAAKEQAPGGFADSIAGEDATPEQKAEMRALVERTNFFDSTVDDSSVTVNGVDTYKVAVKLNKPEIVTFAKEAARINKQEMSADDVKELEKNLGEVDFDGTLYIGVQDKLLHRVTGTFVPTANSEIRKEGNFLATLDATMSDYNADQKITAPVGAEPFDLAKIMSGGTATAMPSSMGGQVSAQ